MARVLSSRELDLSIIFYHDYPENFDL